WTMKMSSLSAITTPKPAAAPAAPAANASPASTPAATASVETPKPAEKPTASSAPARGTGNTQANGGRGGRDGQNGQNNNGRPSLTGAFQRADLNQSGDLAAAGTDGAIAPGDAADLSSSADAAFVVNGSVSRGLDMPQQNDWFG